MDWGGNKLCLNSKSLLQVFPISKVQVPQGQMAGCSAREANELVLALYAKIKNSQMGRQKGIFERG
jgi:hypothetical protein